MEPGLVRQWIDALLSGEYRQGRMQLKDRYDGYCCLGVAVEACFGGFNTSENTYLPSMASLSDDDAHKLGLEKELSEDAINYYSEKWNRDDVPPTLISLAMYMNDTIGATFDEIASVLEEELMKVGVLA
jgi:hypothetical protein